MVKSDWVFCEHEPREIHDPCITAITQENGICKLPDDCRQVFQDPFNRPSLCGFLELTPIVCCPNEQIINSRKIGDSCFVEKSNENGICEFAEKCMSAFDKPDQQPSYCGFVDFIPVVCCPVEEQNVEVTMEPEIIGDSCIVNTTSEDGIFKLNNECETLLNAVYTFCGNMHFSSIVCCPLKKEHKGEPAQRDVDNNYIEEDFCREGKPSSRTFNLVVNVNIEC